VAKQQTWVCPKCKAEYQPALPIKGYEHQCPKTGKYQAFKLIHNGEST
jgi:hypothetical protein